MVKELQIEEEKANPLEDLVKRIDEEGYSLQEVFRQFDANNDQLLTLKEISEGFVEMGLEVTHTEMKILRDQIDKNGDGVCTLEEFTTAMKPPLEVRKSYKAIMKDTNIDDPLDLEEKILDLTYRIKIIEKQVAKVPDQLLKTAIEKKKNPLEKVLSDRVTELENKIIDKKDDEE